MHTFWPCPSRRWWFAFLLARQCTPARRPNGWQQPRRRKKATSTSLRPWAVRQPTPGRAKSSGRSSALILAPTAGKRRNTLQGGYSERDRLALFPPASPDPGAAMRPSPSSSARMNGLSTLTAFSAASWRRRCPPCRNLLAPAPLFSLAADALRLSHEPPSTRFAIEEGAPMSCIRGTYNSEPGASTASRQPSCARTDQKRAKEALVPDKSQIYSPKAAAKTKRHHHHRL